jgi:hypothetical protein
MLIDEALAFVGEGGSILKTRIFALTLLDTVRGAFYLLKSAAAPASV